MKNKANLQFQSFKVPESHIVFKEQGDYKIRIGFNPSAIVNKNKQLFILNLGVKVNDENEKFLIQIDTKSVFKYSDEVELGVYLNSFFIFNAPAIVFPYIRAYITNLSAQSGMSPLVLPTLNLSSLGDDLKQNIKIIEVD